MVIVCILASCSTDSYSKRYEMAKQYWYGHENTKLAEAIQKKAMSDPQMNLYSDIVCEYIKDNLKDLDHKCIAYFANEFTLQELKQLNQVTEIEAKYRKIYPIFEARIMKEVEPLLFDPVKIKELRGKIADRKKETSEINNK